VQSAPTPARSVWGTSGGVVGPAAYKVDSHPVSFSLSPRYLHSTPSLQPPRAVIAPVSSRERPIPSTHSPAPNGSTSTTTVTNTVNGVTTGVEEASVRVQNEEDVPESWDAEEQQ
jgi:hypothetical protein